MAFARKAGVTADGAEALKALRALPAAAVVNGMNMMASQPDTYAGPMIDGVFIVEEAEPAFRAGRQAQGAVHDRRQRSRVRLLLRRRPIAPRPCSRRSAPTRTTALKAYDPDGSSKSEAAVQLMSDQAMGEPARFLARLAAPVQPTYAYRFSYVASSLRAKEKGALHATEIPFVFSTVKAKYDGGRHAGGRRPRGGRERTTGSPSRRPATRTAPGVRIWPVYSAAKDEIMDFTTAGPKPGPDPRKPRLDLVDRLASAPPK